MGLSFSTHIDIIFVLLSVWYLRTLSTSKYNGSRVQPVDTSDHKPTLLSPKSGWDLDSPLKSASIPSITISPAMSPDQETSSSLEKRESQGDNRIVTFAPRAVIVEDIQPPSTASSDTFPSADGKPHGRRGSDQIKIDSVLAQAANDAKHTLKSRPLTPFVRYTGKEEEEPLTAEVTVEFEVKDVSSVIVGKSIESGGTLDAKAEVLSVTFAEKEDTIAQPLLSARL